MIRLFMGTGGLLRERKFAMADEKRTAVSYLVFDIEAIADGELVSRIRFPGENLSAEAAIAKYRAELMETTGKDVLPVTYMLPVSVAIAKIDPEFRLLDLVVLDAPEYRPHRIAQLFWQGWQHYGYPTLVSFNGRSYDMPVLELAALRYGFSIPAWFSLELRSFEQPRNRYNSSSHFDLCDFFSNFGATRLSGGLNLLANVLGKPGKSGIDGSMVQDFHHQGRDEEINDYCRCDVLDTYFVFLRSQVLQGKLTLQREQQLVGETKTWLENQAASSPAYQHYLSHWGDWQPPPV
ncbi:putative 3'-5' exonuclease related to the exonuclease domain of PolB [Planctopirus ephydatiae]|uniref:Putative 3'-5' exonuclease related to the exonuclease domain of PolB n=1 Tax=Planctopirus ephydatiae TaxID=2528019 RepID=A0A518GJV4_9PLAN|nr:3'-5' exonuclease [Planctopirus ephydatiae]QDV28885.1 putative 3'-5' exonuclease related to the exonuclease domain of PolB [Planctopirus ephydatiae]